MLATIAEVGFGELLHHFEMGAARGETSDAKLIEVGIEYVRFAADHPALFRLMFASETPQGAPGEKARAAFGFLRDLAGEANDPQGDEYALRVYSIGKWALVHGFAMLLIDGRIDEPETYEKLLRDVLAKT